ncbi:UNVERIFIED_CONTAM: hypothetical protein Slati_4252800 [Sesamum latifolium]|uniref:Uncharacterized protein n=1 Tax=Sesamum latifolium TaxID=2727402 RepID=A0AAW2TCR8_9LAMI
MVMIRADRHLNMPPPAYHPDSDSITVAVFYGGELRNMPIATCIGGNAKKFDYVNVNHMSKNCLVLFAEKCGISGEGLREFTVYVEHHPPQPNEVAVETVGPASKNKVGERDATNHEKRGLEDTETNNELGTRGVGISEEDSEFLDDEYDMGIDSGEDDDDIFEKFVDEASAEMGIGEGSSSEYDSNDVVASENDLDEHRKSDDEEMGLIMLSSIQMKCIILH